MLILAKIAELFFLFFNFISKNTPKTMQQTSKWKTLLPYLQLEPFLAHNL